MKLGMVFPGQGSQSVGMLRELVDTHSVARDTFTQASDALGYDLSAMMLEGPEAELNSTQNTQPAVLVAAIAAWRVWRELGGPMPQLMAGHSVGEFTALVCAQALPFAEAVRFVNTRGKCMQAAVPEGDGAVAAVLGLDDDAVVLACAVAAGDQVVSAVNFNAPGQVVIAGHTAAVERALAAAQEAGARKVMVLPVSVPVHCQLMEAPGKELEAHIDALTLSAPSVPIVHNVDVRSHATVDQIRAVLRPHIYSPVPWTRTIEQMRGEGVDTIIECGPGKILAGLIKRIDRKISALPIFDTASVDKALAAVQNDG